MAAISIKRALISVYDKTGIANFARALVKEFGIEIISTGGTADLLAKEGVPVTLVEELTGFGAMLDGRVKTLHPAIHAAILADRDNPDHMRQLEQAGIKPIDMVVVNLYPFGDTIADPACTFDQAIEMIDIGGPCLIRAAAKNHKHVLLVQTRLLYGEVLKHFRRRKRDSTFPLHTKDTIYYGMLTTATYDSQIAEWSSQFTADADYRDMYLRFIKRSEMRYGENPHQIGQLYAGVGLGLCLPDLSSATIHGPEMSYNNYQDGAAAIALCVEVARAKLNEFSSNIDSNGPKHKRSYTCVFVKHTGACGVGIADNPKDAYQRAYLGDPAAAMGGVLACDFVITAEFADTVMNSLTLWGKAEGVGAFFIEVWLAPEFDTEALNVVRSTKIWGERVRIVECDIDDEPDGPTTEIRSIAGTVLLQTRDTKGIELDQWTVATKRRPTDREWCDLKLAWLCAKHAKSNAISLVRNGQLLASGAGQTSRVVSCELAVHLARRNRHLNEGGDMGHCVAASDGFFPFRDGPDILMDAGVTAIIQPGGSKRDEDTIAACNERGVVCVMTGTRHFRH